MSATIEFIKNSIRNITEISYGDRLTALETYAQQLKSYSTAAINYLSVTTAKSVSMLESTGDYAAVSMQAKLLVRDLDTNKLLGILIPAPIAFLFEEVEGQGYRVKQALGEEITGYYATFAGLNLRYEEGWLVGGR